MSEFKGTPAPWKFVHQNHATKPSGQGQRYAVMAHVIDYLTRPDDRWLFNIKLDKTADLDLHREAEANARLISAAPDLLKALQGILLMVDFSNSDMVHLKEADDSARLAINKALGLTIDL